MPSNRFAEGGSDLHQTPIRSGYVLVLPILLASGVVLAYVMSFRSYGLNVEDEGTLLYQIVRVAYGELPYVDFSTGYTPLFFVLMARAWRAAGTIVAFRTVLAVVHAITAATLALLVGRVARPAIAAVVPLLYVAFIPVFPGEFCAFNIPYPAWLATLGWTLTASTMLAFVATRRRGWLVAAGVVAAATLGIKPNAGVFAVSAATATLLLVPVTGDEARSPFAGALWVVFCIGLVVSVGATFGRRVLGAEGVVYVAPIVLAMGALYGRARVGRAALVGDALALLVPFSACSVPWIGFFLWRLGPSRFAREVLLIGSGAADLYYRSYPPFEPWALLVTALVTALAAAGALVRRVPRLVPLALGVAFGGLIAGLALVARLGVMPERMTWSIIWQLESAGFPLTLGTHAAGVLWLWRRRRTEVGAAGVVLVFALFMYLQLYPRADFTHLVIAAPLTLVFAAFLLERVVSWWEDAVRRAGWRTPWLVASVAVAMLAAAVALRVSPNLAALAVTDHHDTLPSDVAPVRVDRMHGRDLHELAAAASALAAALDDAGTGTSGRADSARTSLGFPALDMALVMAGARNPTAHDYFYPGRPDHGDEAEIVDALAAAPPRALASLNRHFTFFDAAPAYYFLLRRFVREHYVLRARDGRYDVLVRRDGDRSAPTDGGASVERREAEAAAPAAVPALLLQATADDAATRAVGLARLVDALAVDPEAGLETYVDRGQLDLRRQVLLLRTIRDAREARAASYLFRAAASGERRLVNEALDAMDRTRAELVARRHLWSGPEVPGAWPARQTLVAIVRAVLGDAAAPAPAVAFAAELAGLLGDASFVPALRMRLAAGVSDAAAERSVAAGDAATIASTAAALADLAPEGLACDLAALLARDDPAIVERVPSVFLQLADRDEPVRSEARTCLARAAAVPSPARAALIWVASQLVDASFAPAFRAALQDSRADVRRAAAWALGELASDTSSEGLLAQMAREDRDGAARRAAAGALAKRAGTAPRVIAQGATESTR